MSFLQALHAQFNPAQMMDLCLRLLLACLFGSAIGFERSKRFKEAGIRTHIIVCCGAALFMIVSKYGFADLTMGDGSPFSGTRGADPARVAAQVVSGISFLCAGVIFKNGGTFKGLTTAACLWGVAKRVLTTYGSVRPDMGEGCPERLDPDFLKWVWNFNRNKRQKYYDMLSKLDGKQVFILKNRRQVRAFLEKSTGL